MGFYRLQNEYYFIRKCIFEPDVVNDVTCTRKSVITRVVMAIFRARCYPIIKDTFFSLYEEGGLLNHLCYEPGVTRKI